MSKGRFLYDSPMRSDAFKTKNSTPGASSAEDFSIFPKFDRGIMFDSLGLSCYIAWSFVFWNGSILFGDLRHEVPVGEAQILQSLLTAAAALLLVLLARKIAPLRRRRVLLALLAVISSLAIVLAAFAGFGKAPMGWMLVAFALSGVGSTLRLGWEERLSMQGVHRTAVCAGTAYLFGFLLFAFVSLLPEWPALVASALLPFGAYVLLMVADRTGSLKGSAEMDVSFDCQDVRSFRARASSIPWKLMAAISLAFFSYGATRVNGIMGGFEAAAVFHGALAGAPALASFAAIVLAYFFYRKNAMLAFYLAFPLMALASLLPASLDPFGGGTTFCVALVGAELVKYLVWFLLVDSFFKDGLAALLCLALMRFVQWTGSCLGQVAADVLPTPESVSIAVLLSLMVALLIIMGSPASFKGVTVAEDAASVLERRVAQVAARCKLSPREQEVLAIWATGHTGAYIEKRLFISKNTVKTHLNHIYAKTNTSNREELLQLLESVDVR